MDNFRFSAARAAFAWGLLGAVVVAVPVAFFATQYARGATAAVYWLTTALCFIPAGMAAAKRARRSASLELLAAGCGLSLLIAVLDLVVARRMTFTPTLVEPSTEPLVQLAQILLTALTRGFVLWLGGLMGQSIKLRKLGIDTRLDGVALLAGTVIMVLAAAVGLRLAVEDRLLGPALKSEAVFTAAMVIGYIVAGAVVARIGRRLGTLECLFMVLGTTAILIIAGERSGPTLFGAWWTRKLILLTVAGAALSVLGGSFAFLVFGTGGKPDAHMGFEADVGRRFLMSRGSRGFVSATSVFAVVGVVLGVAALIAVTAVMSGYQREIQSKILSANAHLVVQKYGVNFTEHREVMDKASKVEGVLGATPFVFTEIMISADDGRMAGVLVKGIEGATVTSVTPLPSQLLDGRLENLREPAAIPEPRTASLPQDWAPCKMTPAAPGPAAPRKGEEPPATDSSEARLRRAGADDGSSPGSTDRKSLPGILIGCQLARELTLQVGNVVKLGTPLGGFGRDARAPRSREYRVAGLFHSGLYEFDERLVYLDLPEAQDFLGMGKAVTGVEIRVAEPERVQEVQERVYKAIDGYPFRTVDWREMNAGIFAALQLQKIMLFIVLTFIVIVAAFNIAGTLFMVVLEKSTEIGILKSMGARDASIMKIFVFEGFVVGLAGTTLGVALGLFLCWLVSHLEIRIAPDVYWVEHLTVDVQFPEIALIAGCSLIISHLATLEPALRAARLPPVEAMRYE